MHVDEGMLRSYTVLLWSEPVALVCEQPLGWQNLVWKRHALQSWYVLVSESLRCSILADCLYSSQLDPTR